MRLVLQRWEWRGRSSESWVVHWRGELPRKGWSQLCDGRIEPACFIHSFILSFTHSFIYHAPDTVLNSGTTAVSRETYLVSAVFPSCQWTTNAHVFPTPPHSTLNNAVLTWLTNSGWVNERIRDVTCRIHSYVNRQVAVRIKSIFWIWSTK